MVLFQLPVFYSDKKRRKQVYLAYKSWYKELYGDNILGEYARVLLRALGNTATYSKKIRKLIESHDMLVAVSRSIPLEMGEEWINRFLVLDP